MIMGFESKESPRKVKKKKCDPLCGPYIVVLLICEGKTNWYNDEKPEIRCTLILNHSVIFFKDIASVSNVS